MFLCKIIFRYKAINFDVMYIYQNIKSGSNFKRQHLDVFQLTLLFRSSYEMISFNTC